MENRVAAVAGLGFSVCSLFLVFVAVFIGSPPLFYMSTALVALLVGCRIQSWLSIRKLQFQRKTLPVVQVGERVRIDIEVKSRARIKAGLITLHDQLPPRLKPRNLTSALPIAPTRNEWSPTSYEFTPSRRGEYRWSKVLVSGSDPLGLQPLTTTVSAPMATLLVVPIAIPVEVPVARGMGLGFENPDSGQSKGVGVDPRGVRAYQHGDPIRHVHWRSTAKRGSLQVKEFDIGAYGQLGVVLQEFETGETEGELLDFACGNALFLAQELGSKGMNVEFPQYEVIVRDAGSLNQLALKLALAGDRDPRALIETLERFGQQSAMQTGLIIQIIEPVEGLQDVLIRLRSQGKSIAAITYVHGESSQGSRMKAFSKQLVAARFMVEQILV